MAGKRVTQYENEVKITPGVGMGGVEVTPGQVLLYKVKTLKKKSHHVQGLGN